ncbi:hypothetical protein HOLleu_45111 [Holothuria leucospilota]|uniref:THAP-type domain-containing protein n=1 Tax=Holothuria leucospilota TaxID=206669 RepID=A0A9Q1BA38_HOLLE|nr:hypothetical protein HOLleu_45111 [Holothuria leucospilota]
MKFDIRTFESSKDNVVCEDHFTEDCFKEDIKSKIMGTKARKILKDDAVATVFSFRPPPKPRLSRIAASIARQYLNFLNPQPASSSSGNRGTKTLANAWEYTESPEGPADVEVEHPVSSILQRKRKECKKTCKCSGGMMTTNIHFFFNLRGTSFTCISVSQFCNKNLRMLDTLCSCPFLFILSYI